MILKSVFNGLKFAGLFLLLGSCTTATNLAASFIPAFNQEIDTSELKSGTYQLDPRHSSLHMSFDHMGFSRTVGRFDAFEATLVFDKENPGTAQLTVTIDAASINIFSRHLPCLSHCARPNRMQHTGSRRFCHHTCIQPPRSLRRCAGS